MVTRTCPLSAQVKCCGWVDFHNWTDNADLMNRTELTFPCSCQATGDEDDPLSQKKGFCQAPANSTANSTTSSPGGRNDPELWPVYKEVCAAAVPVVGAWATRLRWVRGCH